MTDKDDDLHEQVLRMADRLGLEGNDRRKYVHDHMTRAGYRMEPNYVPGDDNDDDDEDDAFFSRRRRRPSGRDSDERSRTRRPRREDDSWYT